MIARLLTFVIVCLVGKGTVASGQDIVVYRPVAVPVVSTQAVTYRPVVVQRPVVVSGAPVTVYRPVVPASAVTVYRPAMASAVTVYSPVVAAPATVVATTPAVVTAARPIVVRTKVYVPGQPIRNVLRAVTP
jgi:hypothetical protein